MMISKPNYYDAFQCIADRCPDSCCKEWEVQVDAATAHGYRALTGELGERLREVLYDEDDETYIRIEQGRCPMWRADGLCRIQAELGEESLCKTCREFPRLTHDFGDFVEYGLELSCPEAARILLSTPEVTRICTQVSEETTAEYDREAMQILKQTRERACTLIADTSYRVAEMLSLLLLYGYQAQAELDGAESTEFSCEIALENARNFSKNGNSGDFLAFFETLEILTPAWKEMLASAQGMPFDDRFRALARYFTDRYWLQAVSDYDLVSRVKLTVISCIAIALVGGDLLRTAQLYSKEIENDAENVDAILDAAYTYPAFTDEKLLGILLKGEADDPCIS